MIATGDGRTGRHSLVAAARSHCSLEAHQIHPELPLRTHVARNISKIGYHFMAKKSDDNDLQNHFIILRITPAAESASASLCAGSCGTSYLTKPRPKIASVAGPIITCVTFGCVRNPRLGVPPTRDFVCNDDDSKILPLLMVA